jgi:membrane-bound lytic murein transglycosylase B
MALKRILVFGLCLLVAPGLVWGANPEIDQLKDRESQAEIRIQSLRDDLVRQEHSLDELFEKSSDVGHNIWRIEREMETYERRILELTQTLEAKAREIENVRLSLAGLLRDLEVNERTSLVTAVFNQDNFSDVLRQADYKQAVAEQIALKYDQFVKNTESLETARDQLEMAKLALASSRLSLDLQKQALSAQENERQTVISASRTQLRTVEQERAEIRRQIFALAYDNTTRAINFEEAIHYAQLAHDRLKAATGQVIPVSFMLALVRHESNFGNYLGKGHYQTAMCSQAQKDAFVRITSSLGLDPEITPVSRPAQFQSCGGAMGYAQFLPTTWLGYNQRVSTLTGNHPASPWDPQDAFMAVALKLAAGGAANGNTPAEKRRAQWEAAMTYFSGSNWKKPGVLPNIRWYGDNVLQTADGYAYLVGE